MYPAVGHGIVFVGTARVVTRLIAADGQPLGFDHSRLAIDALQRDAGGGRLLDGAGRPGNEVDTRLRPFIE